MLDSGDGVTHTVPVFEGFSMQHAIRRIDVAGRYVSPVSTNETCQTTSPRDITNQLQLLLRKSGHHLHTTAEHEVVRIIKEKCCYIALNPSKEEKDSLSRSEDFRLPDGTLIQVRSSSVWTLDRLLSRPSSHPSASVHQRYCSTQSSSVRNTPVFTRSSSIPSTAWIWTSAKACFRTSCSVVAALSVKVPFYVPVSTHPHPLPGFGDRLLNEVKKLALKDIKIKIYAPPERKYSTWIGGSILAGLGTFKKVRLERSSPSIAQSTQMWVSAEEYQEDPDIIHKKLGF